MGKEKDVYVEFMRKFVSVCIYLLMFLVATFILYKIVLLFAYVFSEMYLQILNLPGMISGNLDRSPMLWIKLAEDILNVVTFLLVLVKSFKILVSYSRYHHIQIRDLVEISIIALLMEVVFNFWIHSMWINILFSILGVALVIVYVTFPYFRRKIKV